MTPESDRVCNDRLLFPIQQDLLDIHGRHGHAGDHPVRIDRHQALHRSEQQLALVLIATG